MVFFMKVVMDFQQMLRGRRIEGDRLDIWTGKIETIIKFSVS
jgi:hypothetical protein